MGTSFRTFRKVWAKQLSLSYPHKACLCLRHTPYSIFKEPSALLDASHPRQAARSSSPGVLLKPDVSLVGPTVERGFFAPSTKGHLRYHMISGVVKSFVALASAFAFSPRRPRRTPCRVRCRSRQGKTSLARPPPRVKHFFKNFAPILKILSKTDPCAVCADYPLAVERNLFHGSFKPTHPRT